MKSVATLEEELRNAREEVFRLREVVKSSAAQFISLRHLNLSRSEKTIIYALATSRHSVSAGSLRRRLDVVLGRKDDSALITVAVTISRLRKKLMTNDPPIKIMNERGVGFYLDDESKTLLLSRT